MTDDATTMASRDIHRRRYPHTINSEGRGTALSNANQSGRMHTAIDITPHVQISDGTIAGIAEERTSLTVVAPNVNSQRMAIAVECTPIRGILE